MGSVGLRVLGRVGYGVITHAIFKLFGHRFLGPVGLRVVGRVGYGVITYAIFKLSAMLFPSNSLNIKSPALLAHFKVVIN